MQTLFTEQTAPDEATQALATQLPIAVRGPVVEIVFPTAGVVRDVPHGLERVPDGYVVILEDGGFVRSTTYSRWSDQIAWMVSTADNTRARVCFYTLREGSISNVVP